MRGLRSLDPLKNLTTPPKSAKHPRPKRHRTFTHAPKGPVLYQLAKNPDNLNDWFSPPQGFVTGQAHNSAEEWPYYKALMLKLDPGRDPRRPPYTGGKHWTYQTSVDQGRVSGGQVYDFVVDQGFRTLAIRIQTERFHVMASATKQASDAFLKTHQRAVDLVIDIYTQYAIGDPTGKSFVAQIAKALKGEQEPNPGVFGIAQQVRARR